MAGIKLANWLELPSTISLLKTLESIRKSGTSDYQLNITKMESPAPGGGTWLHEDLALEYARWHSDGMFNATSLMKQSDSTHPDGKRTIDNFLKSTNLDKLMFEIAENELNFKSVDFTD